jgi:hypothetical protein
LRDRKQGSGHCKKCPFHRSILFEKGKNCKGLGFSKNGGFIVRFSFSILVRYRFVGSIYGKEPPEGGDTFTSAKKIVILYPKKIDISVW